MDPPTSHRDHRCAWVTGGPRILPTEESTWSDRGSGATVCIALGFDLSGRSPHCYTLDNFRLEDSMVTDFTLDGRPVGELFGPLGDFTDNDASLLHEATFFWPDDAVMVLWSSALPLSNARPAVDGASVDDEVVTRHSSWMADGDTEGQFTFSTPQRSGIRFTLTNDGEPLGSLELPPA